MYHQKVLELCLSPDLGGLELFVIGCYESFQEKTDCKIMIAPNKKLDKHMDGADKFYLKRNKLFPMIPAIKLAKFIEEHEIDIIHFHWTKDIATVVLAKIITKRKIKIVKSRHMTMTRFKDDIYHQWLYKHIDIIHAITYQVKSQLEKFIPEKIRPEIEVSYLGTREEKVNVQKVMDLKKKYLLDKSFIVGIIGRIEEGKGQYLLLEALAKLQELDIKVMIVGDTMDKEYLEGLKSEVNRLGISRQVLFTGFTKEVTTHINLFDVTVLASEKETFGLVVIESMMNKVPVIAVNEGGPLEIIDDGENGLLSDRTSKDLAVKIELLYQDKVLKDKLALAAYKKAKEEFNSNQQFNKLFTIVTEKEV